MKSSLCRTLCAAFLLALPGGSLLALENGPGTNSRAVFPVSGLRALPSASDEVVGPALRAHAGLMQAVAALRAGLPAEALGGLGEAAPLDGNTGAVATYFYAEALVRVAHPENALYYYNDFLARFPGHALCDDVLLGMAFVYLEAGRAQDAAHWLERLVGDCPQGDRVPLARMLLERLAQGGRPVVIRTVADGDGRATADRTGSRPVDDGRESRLDAREKLLAAAEQKLDVDRKRVLALEARLLAQKQQLDGLEKTLAARTLALDKREKELKDFENR